ncbi:hypothetical protein MBLNU13_g08239t2 [Cladosporium sp. NU13]
MLAPSIATLTAALTLSRLISVTCLLQNQMEPGSESEAVPEGLCVPQAKGNYHLSFSSSRITKSNGLCGSRTQDPGLAIVGESRVGFAGPLPCMLKSVRDSPSGSVTTDPALRTPQNAGNIQYTMETADPPTISIYDSECREVALFRRETAPDYCPWPIKIDYLGEGRDMTIPKWDANQHIFAFEFRGRTYEAGFTKTLNDVRGGLREYASRSGVYVLWKRKFFVTSELVFLPSGVPVKHGHEPGHAPQFRSNAGRLETSSDRADVGVPTGGLTFYLQHDSNCHLVLSTSQLGSCFVQLVSLCEKRSAFTGGLAWAKGT